MKPNIRDPKHARLLAREAAATPPAKSWWAERDLTWDQWSERQRERARELNAVSQNYAQPVKMGDE